MDINNLPEGITIKKGEDGKPYVSVKLPQAPKISNTKKIKVFWYSDFLRHTGFGNVAEEILKRLHKTGKYEFTVLGINHMGTPYNIPGGEYYALKDIPVYPAEDGETQFGYQKLAKFLDRGGFDVFFCLQDAFNLAPLADVINETRKKNKYSYIFYFPVDGMFKEIWVKDGVQVADIPVVYTQYGYDLITEQNPLLKDKMRIMYHGIDLETYKPITPEERAEHRKKQFGEECTEEDFVITNVNRNQPRKDLPRTLLAFKLFCERYPHIKSRLYFHSMPKDVYGHNLSGLVRQLIPKNWVSRITFANPKKFGFNGYPTAEMKNIYGTADLITSTTQGEGWGLSTVEAMACEVPVVIPNNTSTTEIIGENEERGYLVASGNTPNNFMVMRSDNEILRPLTDIEDLVEKWKHVYDNREEAKQKAIAGRKWLEDYTWDKMAAEWDVLFQEAYFKRNNA